MTDEVRYRLLRLLQANPGLSQRDVARALNISLGKVNFCLKALIQRGLVKASNFKNSRQKSAYMYLLTPRGIEEKARLTMHFWQLKRQEYEMLESEVQRLRAEIKGQPRG